MTRMISGFYLGEITRLCLAKLVAATTAREVDTSASAPELDNARFEITGLFDRSGMYDVWIAKDTASGRDVLIRVLHDFMADDFVFVRDFERVVSLSFDGTPTLIASGSLATSESGRTPAPYVVLEYVNGVDLRQLIREHGALDPQVAIYIMARAARILADCHALLLSDGSYGLRHGAVKPGHIIVSEDGAVSLLDFGVGVDLSGSKKQARARENYDWASSPTIQGPTGPARDEPERPKKGLLGKIATMLRGESKTEDKPADEKSPSGRRDFWK